MENQTAKFDQEKDRPERIWPDLRQGCASEDEPKRVARNLQEQKTYKEEVPESIIVSLKGSGRAFIWLRFFDNFYEDYKAVIDLSSIADEYNFCNKTLLCLITI